MQTNLGRPWAAAMVALLAAACTKPAPAPTPRPVPQPMGLATVRRVVESMLGQVLGVQQCTSLESCLVRLMATADGQVELAAIAAASPFAAWDPQQRVFFYSYCYVLADSGPAVRAIGGDGREHPFVGSVPLRGARCVHVEWLDGQLCVQVALTTGRPVSFVTERIHAVLDPGRNHDLRYQRRPTATPWYELVATRAVD